MFSAPAIRTAVDAITACRSCIGARCPTKRAPSDTPLRCSSTGWLAVSPASAVHDWGKATRAFLDRSLTSPLGFLWLIPAGRPRVCGFATWLLPAVTRPLRRRLLLAAAIYVSAAPRLEVLKRDGGRGQMDTVGYARGASRGSSRDGRGGVGPHRNIVAHLDAVARAWTIRFEADAARAAARPTKGRALRTLVRDVSDSDQGVGSRDNTARSTANASCPQPREKPQPRGGAARPHPEPMARLRSASGASERSPDRAGQHAYTLAAAA